MNRARHTQPPPVANPPSTAAPVGVKSLVTAMTIALLAVRPLLSEVYEPVSLAFLDSLELAGGATPLLTVTLDFLLLVCCFVMLSPYRANRQTRFVGLALGGLAVAVGLSSYAASNHRLALNAGASMLIAAIVGAVLIGANLPSVFRRTLVSAFLATLVIFSVKCWLQVYVEFPETRADWERRKTELAVEGYRPEMINFERRLLAAEASGYQAHSNVAASLLMMGLLPLVGLALASVRAPTTMAARGSTGVSPVSSSLIAGAHNRLSAMLIASFASIFVAGALLHTGSTGAYVSTLVGLAVFAILQTTWAARTSPTRLLIGFVAAYAFFVAVLLGWGLSQGTFPHASLAFRWEYWTAGWKAWLDQPWTGLGRENFLAGYLQYKQAWATEEVRNPHSLWATLLFELGPLGLLSGVALLLAAFAVCLRAATSEQCSALSNQSRALADQSRTLSDQSRARKEAVFNPIAAAVPPALHRFFPFAVPVLIIALQAWGGENHFEVPGWPVLWLTEFALPWLAAYVLLQCAFATIDHSDTARRALAAGLTASFAAAIFHNTIDYSLTTSPGQAVLVALVAACGSALQPGSASWPGSGLRLAGRRADAENASPRPTRAVHMVTFLLVSVVLFQSLAVVIPSARTTGELPTALAALRDDPARANEPAAYAALLHADPLDPGPPRAVVRECLRISRQSASDATLCRLAPTLRGWIALAVERDPRSLTNQRLAADVEVAAARGASNADDRRAALRSALEHRRRATQLYPTEPRLQVQLAIAVADLCIVATDSTGAVDSQPRAASVAIRELATEGLAALRVALEIDAARKPIDVVRLQPDELRQLEELRSALVRFADSPQ